MIKQIAQEISKTFSLYMDKYFTSVSWGLWAYIVITLFAKYSLLDTVISGLWLIVTPYLVLYILGAFDDSEKDED